MIQSVLNYGIPLIKWRLTDACNYGCSYCIRGPQKVSVTEDVQKCSSAVPYVEQIINNLQQRFNSKIKIDLIGGEVSLLNLVGLFDKFSTLENIEAVNITTNCSRDVNYYADLYYYLKEKDVKFTMTASFHYEKTTLDAFFEKAQKLHALNFDFKIETVQTADNSYVAEFIRQAQELNIYYMVDIDRRNGETPPEVDYCRKKSPRYHIIEDDHSYDLESRNSLLVKYEQKAFPCNGFYCSRDYDYVYIVQDEIIGNFNDHPERGCKNKVHISKYTLLEAPALCIRNSCTICGKISLSKNIEVLTKNAVLVAK